MKSQSLLQLRAVILHPAPDRCVVDAETALLQQFLSIAQRKRIAKVPPDRTKDDAGFGLPPFEDRRSGSHFAILSRHQPVTLKVATHPIHRCDRLLWVLLYRFWSGWRRCLQMVQPDTVLRWHRRAFAWHWTRKSRRRPGRPEVAANIRDLIRRMRLANPLWGAPRIHGELLKLGIAVAQSTVAKYLPRSRKPPSQHTRTCPNFADQTRADPRTA